MIRWYSLLSYFIRSTHRDAFLIYAIFAFFNFFVIDYLLGVNLSGIWIWANSNNPLYLALMFTSMKYSFIFSMYELYKVIKTILFRTSKLNGSKGYRTSKKWHIIAMFFLAIGIIMLIIPILYFQNGFRSGSVIYMASAFAGSVLLSDMLTFIFGGQSLFAYCQCSIIHTHIILII